MIDQEEQVMMALYMVLRALNVVQIRKFQPVLLVGRVDEDGRY